MFSEVRKLISYAIQIYLSVLLVTSVNFIPHFTRQEESYSSDGWLPHCLLCCVTVISFLWKFLLPSQLKIQDSCYSVHVFIRTAKLAVMGEVLQKWVGFVTGHVISVQDMGTLLWKVWGPWASLNIFRGNKKLENLEREFCTTRYAAVMRGWWSCSPFVRDRIFLLLLEVTEEQLQANHSRKGALTFQKFKTFFFDPEMF